MKKIKINDPCLWMSASDSLKISLLKAELDSLKRQLGLDNTKKK